MQVPTHYPTAACRMITTHFLYLSRPGTMPTTWEIILKFHHISQHHSKRRILPPLGSEFISRRITSLCIEDILEARPRPLNCPKV